MYMTGGEEGCEGRRRGETREMEKVGVCSPAAESRVVRETTRAQEHHSRPPLHARHLKLTIVTPDEGVTVLVFQLAADILL
jgi:hypothetical protein